MMDDFRRGREIGTQAACHRRADLEKALARLSATSNLLVLDFAIELANKLASSAMKYGYGDSWTDLNWQADCRKAFVEHIGKGDPIDVALYCAFMWRHNWPTALPETERSPSVDALMASLQSPETQAFLTAILAFSNATTNRTQEAVS